MDKEEKGLHRRPRAMGGFVHLFFFCLEPLVSEVDKGMLFASCKWERNEQRHNTKPSLSNVLLFSSAHKRGKDNKPAASDEYYP